MKTITEEEFDTQFTCVPNHIDKDASCDGLMFETYGQELSYILDVVNSCPNKVWTCMDADDGIYIVSGYHVVNRIGYFITEEPFAESIEFKIM